jgi:hypothetical protein
MTLLRKNQVLDNCIINKLVDMYNKSNEEKQIDEIFNTIIYFLLDNGLLYSEGKINKYFYYFLIYCRSMNKFVKNYRIKNPDISNDFSTAANKFNGYTNTDLVNASSAATAAASAASAVDNFNDYAMKAVNAVSFDLVAYNHYIDAAKAANDAAKAANDAFDAASKASSKEISSIDKDKLSRFFNILFDFFTKLSIYYK